MISCIFVVGIAQWEAPGPGTQSIVDGSTIDFGAVPVGQTRTASYTFKNLETSDTAISCGISRPTPPFGLQDAPPSSFVLAPGQSITFVVTFTPPAVGEYSGSFNIMARGGYPERVETTTVNLTGQGIAEGQQPGPSEGEAPPGEGGTPPVMGPFIPIPLPSMSEAVSGTTDETGKFTVSLSPTTTVAGSLSRCEDGKPLTNQTFQLAKTVEGFLISAPGYEEKTITKFSKFSFMGLESYDLRHVCLTSINPYLAKPICPADQGEVFTPVSEFSWTEAEGVNPSYDLALWEAGPEGESDALTECSPYFEAKGLSETSFTYPDDAPPLLFGKSYIWQVTTFVEGNTFKSPPVLFHVEEDDKVRGAKDSLRALLDHLEKVRKAYNQKVEDFKSNPLVQEVETYKAIAKLLTDTKALSDETWSALEALVQCDSKEATFTLESFQKAMAVLQGTIKLILAAGGLNSKQTTALNKVLEKLNAVKGDINKINEVKDLLCSKDIGDYLKDAVESGVKTAIETAAKKVLAKLVGAKAVGAIYSMISDTANFFAALGTLDDIKDLDRAWNQIMLQLIKAAYKEELVKQWRISSSWTWFCNYIWFDGRQYQGATITLTPRMFCWNPKEGGDEGEGEWCEEQLTFTLPGEGHKTSYGEDGEGKKSLTAEVGDLEKKERGKGNCKITYYYFNFCLDLKPQNANCEGGPCYVVMDVKVTYKDGKTEDIRLLVGVINK